MPVDPETAPTAATFSTNQIGEDQKDTRSHVGEPTYEEQRAAMTRLLNRDVPSSPGPRQPFHEKLRDLRDAASLSQKVMAAKLAVSPQFYHDLETGRRMPSVAIIDKICDCFGRGPHGRLEWHMAGARAHGWRV